LTLLLTPEKWGFCAAPPELVKQDFYGMMLAHRAVCSLMNETALRQNLDPDRLSYTHSIRVIRQKLARSAGLPP